MSECVNFDGIPLPVGLLLGWGVLGIIRVGKKVCPGFEEGFVMNRVGPHAYVSICSRQWNEIGGIAFLYLALERAHPAGHSSLVHG